MRTTQKLALATLILTLPVFMTPGVEAEITPFCDRLRFDDNDFQSEPLWAAYCSDYCDGETAEDCTCDGVQYSTWNPGGWGDCYCDNCTQGG
jgi:hypothetical protein